MCYMPVSTGHQQQGAAGDQSAAPTPRVKASRRLRRATTAGLGLVLGFERTEDVVDAAPRAHQFGIITEPVPHHPVERAYLLHDLGAHRFQIGACAHMIAPSRPRGFDGLLEPAERTPRRNSIGLLTIPAGWQPFFLYFGMTAYRANENAARPSRS